MSRLCFVVQKLSETLSSRCFSEPAGRGPLCFEPLALPLMIFLISVSLIVFPFTLVLFAPSARSRSRTSSGEAVVVLVRAEVDIPADPEGLTDGSARLVRVYPPLASLIFAFNH